MGICVTFSVDFSVSTRHVVETTDVVGKGVNTIHMEAASKFYWFVPYYNSDTNYFTAHCISSSEHIWSYDKR